MTVDRRNIAWCADRAVQLSTRSFLTKKRLITRADKSRAVDARENGFIISEHGLAILQRQSAKSKQANNGSTFDDRRNPERPATERQLNYARDLGIDVPLNANIEELSDLISARLNEDEKSGEALLLLAEQYHVNHTRFTGKHELFGRIFDRLNRPTREVDLLAWFSLQVYKSIAINNRSTLRRPNHLEIYQLAKELSSDRTVINSVRRYRGDQLTHFGEWEDSAGSIHFGASIRTTAYHKVASLLTERFKSP